MTSVQSSALFTLIPSVQQAPVLTQKIQFAANKRRREGGDNFQGKVRDTPAAPEPSTLTQAVRQQAQQSESTPEMKALLALADKEDKNKFVQAMAAIRAEHTHNESCGHKMTTKTSVPATENGADAYFRNYKLIHPDTSQDIDQKILTSLKNIKELLPITTDSTILPRDITLYETLMRQKWNKK